MTEEEKWKLINQCETIDELKDAIIAVGGEEQTIKGRSTPKNVFIQAGIAMGIHVISDPREAAFRLTLLTRSYGIRNQLAYLLYCKQHGV